MTDLPSTLTDVEMTQRGELPEPVEFEGLPHQVYAGWTWWKDLHENWQRDRRPSDGQDMINLGTEILGLFERAKAHQNYKMQQRQTGEGVK